MGAGEVQRRDAAGTVVGTDLFEHRNPL